MPASAFGGMLLHVLLGHGFGAAFVRTVLLWQIEATFAVLDNPSKPDRAVGLTHAKAVPPCLHQHAQRRAVGEGLRALRLLYEHLTGARVREYVVITHAGHANLMDNPEASNRAIIDVLKRVGRAQPV